ncbi:IS3 family transposase [Clostridium botulinum]|uniref:IS3 family transposase n=2 Tax=Clostridium botulinum TaxID=1491 RepID=UPI0039C86D78
MAGVSRSGYYSWLQREQYRIEKEVQDRQDFELILKAFQYKNRFKGTRSIKMVLLRKFHVNMNLKKIRRLMSKYALRCPIRKANPYKKIGKAIKSHAVGNKVNREFCVGRPGKVLLTNITYIYYGSVRVSINYQRWLHTSNTILCVK